MTLRPSAATMLAALLLLAIALVFVLGTPGSSRTPARFSAQAATVGEAPASPLPFEVVIEQLSGEHRALEAAALLGSDPVRLKGLYLECARRTSEQRMDVDDSLYCQAVADVLMHRHFGGNLDRLLEWWQQRSGEDRPLAAADRT